DRRRARAASRNHSQPPASRYGAAAGAGRRGTMSFWQRSPAFRLLPPLGDQPGPARPLSDAELDDLVASTLDLAELEPEAEAPDAPDVYDKPVSSHVWRRSRRRHIWKMAAVTVLALGGIAAAAATTAHVITERRAVVPAQHASASAPPRRNPRP